MKLIDLKSFGFLLLSLLVILFQGYSQEMPKQKEHNQIQYIENKGQWPSMVKFQSAVSGGKLWIGDSSILFELQDFSDLHRAHFDLENTENPSLKTALIQQKFIGSATDKLISVKGETKHYYNYFLGNDSSKWTSNVHAYSGVAFEHFYSDIHLLWESEKNALKYSFFVEPNADSRLIQWSYSGEYQSARVRDGRLVLKTTIGEIIEQRPIAYQLINGKKIDVPCSFRLKDGVFSYEIGNYDHDIPLVIDPVLVFATYNGSISDNFGMTATYGNDGSAYSAGMVYGNNFPIPNANSFDISPNFTSVAGSYGITDVFVTKYSPDGTNMLWSAFLGGGDMSQGTETAHSLICDSLNNIYVFGATSSTNFPTTSGAFQTTHGGGSAGANFLYNGVYFSGQGTDIYISKISANGQSLLASTYVGGSDNDGVNYRSTALPYNSVTAYDSLTTNYGDQFRGEIMLDSLNNVYVASCTRSSNFPTLNAFQAVKSAGQDGVIFKLNSSFSNLQFSSFYGGNNSDACYSVKLDTLGAIVFAGGTCSNNLIGTSGAYQSNFQGGKTDGFVVKLLPSGSTIQKASYVGSNYYDQVFFVEIDRLNQLFLLGQSVGGTFPVNNAPYSNPGSSQFILKLNPTLTTNLASTVIGNGSPSINISPAAFLVDICGNMYVSGWGANILQSVPISGMPISPNAFQPNTTGFDFYLMVVQNDFSGLLYGSYLGGALSHEHVDGGTSRFDKKGIVYQSVCGGCGAHSDFPTSPGAWSSTNNSSNCNNLVFKFDFQLIPTASFTSSNVAGCNDLTVNFQNTSTQIDSYLWDFGNGDTTSSVFNPVVTYTQPGIYNVQLYVTDSVCLLTDTAHIQVLVLDSIQLNVLDTINLCSSNPFDLIAYHNGTGTQFIWSQNANLTNPLNNSNDSIVTVTTPGWYFIEVSNPYCSKLDSVYLAFDVPLSAYFTVADSMGCAPFTLTINNNSTFTTDFVWDLGNGQLDSSTFNPTVTFNNPGTYQIQLNISDSICLGQDSYSLTIQVSAPLLVNLVDTIFLCESVDTTLTPIISGMANQFIWSSNVNFTDTLNVNLQNPLLNLVDPQNQTYYFQADNGYCSVLDSVHVSIFSESINFQIDDSICITDVLQLSANVNPSGSNTYLWSSPNVVISPNNQLSASCTLPGSQYVYFQVTNQDGCVKVDSQYVFVSTFSQLLVQATANPNLIMPGGTTQISGVVPANASFTWSPTVGLLSPNELQTSASPSQTTTYMLVATDGVCTKSDTALVRVYEIVCDQPYVFVPNAFTPNGDKENDVLYVRGIWIEKFVLRIFDRWGELVFETSDQSLGWDGTFKGKKLDPDVFDYYLEVDCLGGSHNIIKGNITLMK
ncbi:MAG: T9SS type B sorting domain-containing protein [Flavobacteriales bacterium]